MGTLCKETRKDMRSDNRKKRRPSNRRTSEYNSMSDQRRRRKRRKKSSFLPALIAIVLILLVGGASVAALYMEKMSYSKETVELTEYFGFDDDDKALVYLANERLDIEAVYVNEGYYLPYDWVKDNINDRFYIDKKEELLLYPLPDEVCTTSLSSSSYTMGGKEIKKDRPLTWYIDNDLYLSIDYVKDLSNFNYEIFENPSRIQLYTQDYTYTGAELIKNSAVRSRGGIKSPILEEVTKGDILEVGEEFENWVEVRTHDMVTGYIEKKDLSEYREEKILVSNDVANPVYSSNTRDHKISLVWQQMIYEGGNNEFDNLTAKMSGVNVISPTWFFVSDDSGNIINISSSDYVSRAHNKGLEVWALADDFTWQQLNPQGQTMDIGKVLSRTSTRQNLIKNLIEGVKNVGADGLNIDFECIKNENGDDFVEFIRELSIPCRQEGIVLSVDNYVPLVTNYYGRKAQGEAADYVIIMGYDEHTAGSDQPGSVASIDYVEHGITETLKEVPAEKIINAVPFYTRLWTTKGNDTSCETIGIATAKETISKRGIKLNWDDTTCQNYGEKEQDGAIVQIWMEDEESLAAKISVMKSNNIGGIAAWKLGFETSDIWDVYGSFAN